ncbi:MAG: ISL3 family transposase [Patescibacteria group bacterium]
MNTPPSSAALAAHYSLALGLTEPWKVSGITLDIQAKTLDIEVLFDDRRAACPDCSLACPLYDLRERRSWRHLDMMQFTTIIHAQTPRTTCPTHGTKTIDVPWADAHSRFTLLFEHFAIEVIQATVSISQAQSLLHLAWDAIQHIKERAVERGLTRRTTENIVHVGIDEKSFLKGHRYVSLATDLDRGRVLEVVEHRTIEAAAELLKKAIPEAQRKHVLAGAMDMWESFMKSFGTVFPDATIVHDRYHISSYLGKAVDMVRRKEHRAFMKDGNELLVGAKYLFLKNTEQHTKDERARFRVLMQGELKVGRAWTLKETFRHFFEYDYVGVARKFFNCWYFRATHSRLKAMIDVAKMLKRHLDGLLSHCFHKISNAVTEGLNSKIQTIKANARGFRNFQHYRVAILFSCGKLNMLP